MQSRFDLESKVWYGPKVDDSFDETFMFGDLIYRSLLKAPERVLQIHESSEAKVTCEDLRVNSIRIVQNLQKIGIAEDDVVSIILNPSPFATYVVNACVLLGAIISPLTDMLDDEDFQHLIATIKPKIIICESSAVQKVARNFNTLRLMTPIYSTSSGDAECLHAFDLIRETGQENEFSVPKFHKTNKEKMLAILCSSGTTGRPKGVFYTHETLFEWLKWPRSTKASTSLLFSSMHWVGSFIKTLGVSVCENELLIVSDRKFSDEIFTKLVDKYKVTDGALAPRYLALLLDSDIFLSSGTESLTSIIVAGSILSKSLRQKFERLCPKKTITVVYGLTETMVCFSLPHEVKNEFSVGSMLLPNIAVKIVDDDENSVGVGQSGEIRIKTGCQLVGYFNDPPATQSAIDAEGFFKTGDIGYFDSKNILYVCDRKKDIVKSNGFHVNPSQIEDVIETIEGVQHACVVGVPDENGTMLLAAGIIRGKGFNTLTEQQVNDAVAAKLSSYKQLHGGVYFFDKFPYTSSDKIKRKDVLTEILERKGVEGK